jgi:hypothetical protein
MRVQSNTAQALNQIEKGAERVGEALGNVIAKAPFYGIEAAAIWGGIHVAKESGERFYEVVTGQLDLGKDAIAEPILQGAGAGLMTMFGVALAGAGVYGAFRTTQDLVQGERKAAE